MLVEKVICCDQGVLLAKLCYHMPCFISYFKAKLAFYSGYLLTFCFCMPVPCAVKDIFFGIGFKDVRDLHTTSQLLLLWY